MTVLTPLMIVLHLDNREQQIDTTNWRKRCDDKDKDPDGPLSRLGDSRPRPVLVVSSVQSAGGIADRRTRRPGRRRRWTQATESSLVNPLTRERSGRRGLPRRSEGRAEWAGRHRAFVGEGWGSVDRRGGKNQRIPGRFVGAIEGRRRRAVRGRLSEHCADPSVLSQPGRKPAPHRLGRRRRDRHRELGLRSKATNTKSCCGSLCRPKGSTLSPGPPKSPNGTGPQAYKSKRTKQPNGESTPKPSDYIPSWQRFHAAAAKKEPTADAAAALKKEADANRPATLSKPASCAGSRTG